MAKAEMVTELRRHNRALEEKVEALEGELLYLRALIHDLAQAKRDRRLLWKRIELADRKGERDDG